MNGQINYFRLGSFILGGLALLVAGLIALGLGRLGNDRLVFETYFNESVQGIDVGSPVKFKGVKIGSIESISLAMGKYQSEESPQLRYVVVEMSVNPGVSIFKGKNKRQIQEDMNEEAERGLRVSIRPQGLTGTAYLEIDYAPPSRRQTLPVSWTPRELYLPSTPSTIARLEETFEAISKTIKKVEEAGVDQAILGLTGLIVDLRTTLKDTNVQGISSNVDKLIGELRETNNRISGLLSGKDAKEGLSNLTGTLANLKATTDSLPAAVNDARKVLKELSELIGSQRDQVGSILQNSKQIMDNLNELSGDVKHNPSRVLFGSPPAPKDKKK